jgi:hypothetical protein
LDADHFEATRGANSLVHFDEIDILFELKDKNNKCPSTLASIQVVLFFYAEVALSLIGQDFATRSPYFWNIGKNSYLEIGLISSKGYPSTVHTETSIYGASSATFEKKIIHLQ